MTLPLNITTKLNELLEIIEEHNQKFTIEAVSKTHQSDFISQHTESLQLQIQKLADLRGQALFYPYLGSGFGKNSLVELINGQIKLDFNTGIGYKFDGYSNPESIQARLEAAISASTMQGNLQMDTEYMALLEKMLSYLRPKSHLYHGWLTLTGTQANEFALKIVRQKNFPATITLAFEDNFAGRTIMLSDITDSPDKRVRQKNYGEVLYVPYFDHLHPESSIQKAQEVLHKHIERYPGQIACFMMEFIQGEGGFRAPGKEFFEPLMKICKKNHIAVFADEVQTFGRTGHLFAFERLGLNEYIDIVTCGKLLQNCALFYTKEYNPQPGFITGTFAGSTVTLKMGYSMLDRLLNQGYLGENGRIQQMGFYFFQKLEALSKEIGSDKISDISQVGGMIAAQVYDGSKEKTLKTMKALYDAGLICYYCGHGPYRLRFLPAMMVVTQDEINLAIRILKQVLY